MPTTLSADLIIGLDAVQGPIRDNGGAVLDVRHPAFGAVGDGRMVSDGNVTTGSAVVTSATAAFTAADLGKPISVTVRPTTTGSQLLLTTIQSVDSATQVTLAAAMTATSTQADLIWGTDDTPAIQAAINAASANGGGTVLVPALHDPARFYLLRRAGSSAWALRMKSHVRLTGDRYGSRLKLLGAQLNFTRMISATAETEIEIDHLTLDGSREQQNQQDFTPFYEHLHAISLYKDNTSGIPCSRVSVHDCDLLSPRGDGVSVSQQSTDVRVERCLIRDSGRGAIVGSTTRGVTFFDNTIEDCASGIHWEPDQTDDPRDTLVSHNRISNCGAGIDLAAHVGAHHRNAVMTHNVITGVSSGIRVIHCVDAIVAFNQIRDVSGSPGIYLYGDTVGCKVIGNVVDGVTGGVPGIHVVTINTYEDIPTGRNELIENTVRNVTGASGTPYGIRVYGTYGGAIRGGLVEGGSSIGIVVGARAGEIHPIEISGVTVRNNGTAGLILGTTSAGGVAGNVKVSGCTFVDDRATPLQTEGIRIQVGTGGAWQRIVLLENAFDGVATPIRRIGSPVVEDYVADLTNAGGPLPTVSTAASKPVDRTVSWRAGDRILNTAPAPGGWAGWIVTGAGRAHQDSTGTLTSGSTAVTGVTNPGTWVLGDEIRGAGIPAGAVVVVVTGTTLQLSVAATASGTAVPLYDAVIKGYAGIEA